MRLSIIIIGYSVKIGKNSQKACYKFRTRNILTFEKIKRLNILTDHCLYGNEKQSKRARKSNQFSGSRLLNDFCVAFVRGSSWTSLSDSLCNSCYVIVNTIFPNTKFLKGIDSGQKTNFTISLCIVFLLIRKMNPSDYIPCITIIPCPV